jgi:hypothetical protein
MDFDTSENINATEILISDEILNEFELTNADIIFMMIVASVVLFLSIGCKFSCNNFRHYSTAQV